MLPFQRVCTGAMNGLKNAPQTVSYRPALSNSGASHILSSGDEALQYRGIVNASSQSDPFP